MRLQASRGFTLLEVLIAAAIAIVLGLFFLRATTSALRTLTATGTRFNEAATLANLSDLWERDEDTAWAIFTPPADVHGASNADGHEVDFYSRDARQRTSFWAYTYDAAAQTLTHYKYTAPGSSPTAIEAFTGVTQFFAHTYPVTALSDPSSKIYSPLFAPASLQDGSVQFFSSSAPWIAGGNQITYVNVQTAHASREMHLSTQTAPSGYIVVLNYTPSPSATVSGLQVWPPAVRYGANGTQLASAGTPRMTAGALFNGLLGGGIADAASSCPAQAFTDSSFTTTISQGTTDPYGGSESITGANGCYDGGIDLNEPGSSAAFFDQAPQSNACTSSEVVAGQFTPSKNGPLATQAFSGGTQATNDCVLGFSDGTKKAQVSASVYACGPVLPGPVDSQVYCLWTGWAASGGPTGIVGATSESQVWYYDTATSVGPEMDCSDPAIGCIWNQNGAVAFCQQPIDPNTGATRGPAITAANAAGFGCSPAYTSTPPAHNWATIPCRGPTFACKNESGGGPTRP